MNVAELLHVQVESFNIFKHICKRTQISCRRIFPLCSWQSHFQTVVATRYPSGFGASPDQGDQGVYTMIYSLIIYRQICLLGHALSDCYYVSKMGKTFQCKSFHISLSVTSYHSGRIRNDVANMHSPTEEWLARNPNFMPIASEKFSPSL